MKKLLAILILITFYTASVQAQHGEKMDHQSKFLENSITFGLASPYSFELNTPGANLRMYYNIGEEICFGPEYAYFSTKDYEIIDFDFVIHYIFETKMVGVYPMAGFNYTVETVDHEGKETKALGGIVFGGGIHRNFKSFTLFAEYSHVELGIRDSFVTAGIMHTFK